MEQHANNRRSGPRVRKVKPPEAEALLAFNFRGKKNHRYLQSALSKIIFHDFSKIKLSKR